MQLKPPRLNTQGPVEEFLREVYKWALSMMSHASRHAQGGDDEIDGDAIDIDFEPANYTPTGDTLGGHLEGLDAAVTGGGVSAHASSHIHGGTDVIDGDRLDVDFVPTNYTRAPGPNGTVDDDELTSNLKGIDNKLGGSFTPTAHASSHIRSGSDEIDGDLVDIDLVPTNYTRTTDGTATNAEHLRAHLNGIDAELLKAKTTTYYGRGLNNLGGTIYICLIGNNDGASQSTNANDMQIIWGRAGTFTNLRLRQIVSSGDADTATVSLNINGSNTALSIAGIAGTNTSVQVDTSVVSVAVNDLVCLSRSQDGAGGVVMQDLTWAIDFIEA